LTFFLWLFSFLHFPTSLRQLASYVKIPDCDWVERSGIFLMEPFEFRLPPPPPQHPPYFVSDLFPPRHLSPGFQFFCVIMAPRRNARGLSLFWLCSPSSARIKLSRTPLSVFWFSLPLRYPPSYDMVRALTTGGFDGLFSQGLWLSPRRSIVTGPSPFLWSSIFFSHVPTPPDRRNLCFVRLFDSPFHQMREEGKEILTLAPRFLRKPVSVQDPLGSSVLRFTFRDIRLRAMGPLSIRYQRSGFNFLPTCWEGCKVYFPSMVAVFFFRIL